MEPVSPSRRAWFDNVGADGEFGLSNPAQYFERSNRETFVVLQIEDRDAVDHVEENAAVEGVTVLFVGPADLSMSLGVPLQFDHPTMQSAIDRVARAAAKAGIWWGTTTSSPAFAQQALDRGARMVTCANDHFLLLDGLRDAYRQFSEISIG